MPSQRTANLAFLALVLAACAWFAWVAEGFETSGLLASSGLPSKFFPHLTLAVIALCALVTGWQYLARGEAGGDDGETVFGDAGAARRGLLMLAVAVLCYLVWRSFGYLPMAVMLGPLSLLAMGVRQPLVYLAVLAIAAAVTAAFVYGLGIRLA